MKEKYVKPTLCVEMFCLTQSIARDCSDSIPQSQLNFSDIHNCQWDLGGGHKVFITPQPCSIDGENMGFVCYNNPSEGNYIFRS